MQNIFPPRSPEQNELLQKAIKSQEALKTMLASLSPAQRADWYSQYWKRMAKECVSASMADDALTVAGRQSSTLGPFLPGSYS